MTVDVRRAVGEFSRWVERLESIPVGASGWAAGFLSIVAVRHLLELRSGGYPLYPPSAFYVHYVLAYVAPLLALSMILALFSNVPLERVLRLMLLAWGLTLLPPLVDSLIARTHEAKIGYLKLGEDSWFTILLRFFDPTYSLQGTTPGIRVETAVACALGATYTFLRSERARIARSVAAAASVYVTSVFFFTLPFLFLRGLRLIIPGLSQAELLQSVGRVARPASAVTRSDQAILVYLVPLTLALAAAALAMYRPLLLRRALMALRVSEGWSWAIVGGLGACAGWRVLEGVPRTVSVVPFDLLALFAGPLALLLGGWGLALLSPAEERIHGHAPGERAVGTALVVSAAILAAAASVGFVSYGSIALGAGLLARGVPRVLPWAFLAPQAASGIGVLAAFLAGYSLTAADEALTLLPSPFYSLFFLAGFLVDLPRSFGGTRRGIGPLSVAASATVPLVMLAVSAAALGTRPSAGWLAVALLLSAAALAGSQTLSSYHAAAISLLGGSIVVGILLGSPGPVSAWRAKALASPTYFIRASERAEAAGDLEVAAGAAGEAVRLAPESADAHQRLALVRLKRRDTEGAIEEFRTAVRIDPTDASLLGNLATALLDTEGILEALAVTDAALRADPDLASTYFVRAQCLDKLGRVSEANSVWAEYVARARGLPDEKHFLEIARRRLAGSSEVQR